MLTSRWLYVLTDLASRFFCGGRFDGPTTVRGLKIEAVDANLANDQWLLVVMPDRVFAIEVNQLLKQSPKIRAFGESSLFTDSIATYPPKVVDSPWESSHEYNMPLVAIGVT